MDREVNNVNELSKFRRLYEELAPTLILYAGKYVDMSTAEDLVQDIFLKIWKKRILLDLDDGLKAYLFRSVQHACLDYLKHQKVEGSYIHASITQLKIDEISYCNTHDIIYTEDNRFEKMHQELDRLPQKCKEIFLMYYIEERKADDIAQILDISKRTVETQLYRALKKLRDALLSTCGQEIYFPLVVLFNYLVIN